MLPSTPNPLSLSNHGTWDRLVAGVNPASMLVAVRGMMGELARQHYDPEDVWQETLLMAWRDRATFEWRGPAAFRRWLLEIARNRIRDLVDHSKAGIRGKLKPLSALPRAIPSDSGEAHYAGPVHTTSPGRAEADRELAERMATALAAVPEDTREVVRLRLFEDLTMDEVAVRLGPGLGAEGVRYRFRVGLDAYRRELRRLRLADSRELFPR
jgi:RNA polymerase sigma factor (sigma-70 family)